MPTFTHPRRPPPRSPRCLTIATALGLASLVAFAACSTPGPSTDTAPDGLIALVAGPGGTTLSGWDKSGGSGIPIALPDGDTVWISTGLSDVLVATLATGKTATSGPVRLGKPLEWRAVKAANPSGNAPKGPDYFATWDPQGGRFATLAGDLVSGDGITLVLTDPSLGTAFEIPIDRPVVAAPPVWLDSDRIAIVTGDAADPAATLVDTRTGGLSDGPIGARLAATSADGRRIATMAGHGAPVVVRDTAGWLSGDGSSIASIAPPNGSTTAIAFALDATGQRVAIAWETDAGAVSLAVHDGRSDWRRVAQPKIGTAKGAVVAWRR